MWHCALADIRNDPPALFLFWLGALLLVAPWRAGGWRFALAGTGIGLAVAAVLWNPKMPVAGAVLGAVYLWRLREAIRVGGRMIAAIVGPAIAIVATTVLLIARTVSLHDYLFFAVQYNLAIGDFNSHFFRPLRPFLHCDPAFKGFWVVVVLVVAAVILFSRRIRGQIVDLDLRSYAIVFALVLAAAIEIRFVLPYPNLWPQYYLVWDFAVAALYGMTITAVLRSIRNARLEAAVQVIVAILAVALVHLALPLSSASPAWAVRSHLRHSLRPGETVWLSQEVHPIAAYDASYYWLGFNDLVPASLQYTTTHPGSPLPQMREEDLPPCRAEQGLEPGLRFVSGKTALVSLPVTRQCLARMIASGQAVRARMGHDIWELRSSRRGP